MPTLSRGKLIPAAVATTPKSLLALDKFTQMSIEAHWRELVQECIRASKETGETPAGETGDTND